MQGKQMPFHRYLLSLLCVAILAGGAVYLYLTPTTLAVEDKKVNQDELAKVHSLYQEIQENYYKEVSKDTLIEGALKGMTESLDDPYTTYFGKEEAEEFNQTLSDSFEGIGATLTIIDDLPEVAQAPIKGSPAEKAGLRAKDKILEVDGNKTAGKTLNEVVSTIRGKKGSEVSLVVQRDETTFDVTITRDKIAISSLEGSLDEKHQTIGKIEIASFSESTANELQEAIENLREQGAVSFVIDVRQNPGGYLDQVEKMASMFLKDSQTIVQFANGEDIIGKSVASKELDGGFKVTEPTVVLVDGGSASASEIFAAALKESADLPVVGTKTFGKGTVQTVSDFGDQSELKMTVQKWLTPKGNWINEEGLEPTIKVDLPEFAYLPPLPKDQTLKIEDSSDTIENLNTFLKALGYDTSGNTFNETTKQAVEDFQKNQSVDVTGQVDSQTASAIEGELIKKIQNSDPMYEKAVETLLDTK